MIVFLGQTLWFARMTHVESVDINSLKQWISKYKRYTTIIDNTFIIYNSRPVYYRTRKV